jgi:phospholipid/cholesterol/gamma-HCH transport system substrate-binding protein
MMRGLGLIGRRSLSAAVALVAAAAVSSCASISVNDLPQPGTSYESGYDIVLEFDNVLNLPDRAPVVMDGTPVGVVDKTVIGETSVDVTARIDRAVQIPSDVHAVLQQATVLGDIYLALERNETTASAHPLQPNERIPLAQTTSPPQLEDTMVNLATFVTSGSIQRIQNTIIGINRVTPERTDEIRAMSHRLSTDLFDLSDNIGTVDQWLSGLAETVNVMARDIPVYQSWFSPEGMRAFDFATGIGSALSTVMPSLGSIYTGGYWLVPFLDSFGIAVGAIQQSKWAIEGEYRPWRKLMTDMFLPADKYPAMNIISVQTPDGREISNNVQDVLRMLGAIP